MNRTEHILITLMEECSEFAKDASKTARFTKDSDWDGLTNAQKLQREFNDLLAMIDLLEDELDIELFRDEALVQAKKEKFERMLLESKRLGTLTDD